MRIGLVLATTSILDSWVNNLMGIISGYISVEAQATTVLVGNIIVLNYMLAFGLDSAACTLIGNEVGAGKANEAIKMMHSFNWVSTIAIIFSCVGLYFNKEFLVDALTSNEDLRKATKDVVWLVCISQFPDMFKGMLKGVIKALSL